MKRRRHTLAQIVRKYHRWRAQYGGMKADDAKRLKELETENARLKRIVARIVADQVLEVAALKEISKGNCEPSRRRQAVCMLQDSLGISERRACRYADQDRSTQRHAPLVASDDAGLRAALRQISRDRLSRPGSTDSFSIGIPAHHERGNVVERGVQAVVLYQATHSTTASSSCVARRGRCHAARSRPAAAP